MDCYNLTLFYLCSSWLKAPPKKEPDLNNEKYKHYQKIYRQPKYFIKVIYAVEVASMPELLGSTSTLHQCVFVISDRQINIPGMRTSWRGCLEVAADRRSRPVSTRHGNVDVHHSAQYQATHLHRCQPPYRTKSTIYVMCVQCCLALNTLGTSCEVNLSLFFSLEVSNKFAYHFLYQSEN